MQAIEPDQECALTGAHAAETSEPTPIYDQLMRETNQAGIQIDVPGDHAAEEPEGSTGIPEPTEDQNAAWTLGE